MDIQVSKINKSDGRMKWWRIFEEGRRAFQRGVSYSEDPYQYRDNPKDSQEWRSGWKEESQSFFDYWKDHNVDHK